MATKVRDRFLQRDVVAVREGAIKAFGGIPSRCRLPNMSVDLSEDDKRVVAFVISSMQHLIRLGVLEPSDVEALFPEVYTKLLQLDDEQVYSPDLSAAKKRR